MSSTWPATVPVLDALAAAPALAKDFEAQTTRLVLNKPLLVDVRGAVGPGESYEFQGTWRLSRLL